MIVDRIPEELRKYINFQVEYLESKCESKEVITNKMIRDLKILEDYCVTSYGKDAITQVVIYAYYLGACNKEDPGFSKSVVEKFRNNEPVK